MWVFGGIALIAMLTVASWFLLIGPKYTEAAEVETQVDDTQTQLIALRRKIADLEKQQQQLPKFREALKRNQAALPSGSGVSDFLRQQQAAGDKVGVSVTAVAVAAPAKATAAADVWELPMTLVAEGSSDNLSRYLTQMQGVQLRAVLVESVNLAQTGDSLPELSMAVTAFVTQPAGSGAPIVTTK
jgi:Tfp pilus assembly protein PilO